MKNTKRILAAFMSAVMLGTFSAVPNMVFAETDTTKTDISRPFTVDPEDDFITNQITVLFKSKYSEDTIENTLIPELKNIDGVVNFLHGHADTAAQLLQVVVTHVHAVHQHRAVADVGKTGDEVDEGGLA